MGRVLVGVWAVALVLGSLANPAHADLSQAAWNEVARSSGIPVELLFAVALQETREVRGDAIEPDPWTIRTPDGAERFASREKAVAHLRQELEKGRENVDVGLMQINLAYHGDELQDPAVLLDPKFNLYYGAKILQEALQSTEDTVLGIGRYHSWRGQRARRYGRDVVEWWRKVRNHEVFR